MRSIFRNNVTIDEETEVNIKIRTQLEQKQKEIQQLKELLKQHFELNIPTYIILDIIEHEDYQHFCLMINLAVVNGRLSEENGITLKNGIKEMFNIQSDYDRF